MTSRACVDKTAYTFGPFRLSPAEGSLVRDGQRVSLGQRAFEVLVLLVERAGEVVSNAEIVTRVWPTTIVDENNLRVHITSLRKALGESQNRGRYILNVPGRGYRFATQVERHKPVPDQRTLPAELPLPLTRLVGRDPFVNEIKKLVSGNRFVTIVGAGGIGKTSVALAVANVLKGCYRDGCFFIDLAMLSDPELVSTVVAEALRVPVASETSLSAIVNHLQHRHVALVFDNCEHVIDRAAEVVEAVLRTAPDVHVLATSREPLRAEGESVRQLSALEVPPELDTPMTAEALIRFSAAELFVERAAAVVSDFTLTDAQAPLLADLCRKLEGIPLAIELAAARIDMFGLAGLVEELSDSLALLTKGRRTAQPRHRTLRATLDWSFGLLNDAEKAVFGRLGVFKATFTRESVVAVLPDDIFDAERVKESLNNLVAKSLVVLQFSNGRVCFRLLDMTRAYALEKLHDDPEANLLRQRHARHFYERVSEPAFEQSMNDVNWLTSFRQVAAEIRIALEWCFSESGDRNLGLLLTAASWFVWDNLSLVDEYMSYGRRALTFIGAPSKQTLRAEAKILIAIGKALYNTQGSAPELPILYGRVDEIAEQLGDVETRTMAALGTWRYHQGLGQHDAALVEAETYANLHPDTLGQSIYMTMRGITHVYQGDLPASREWLSSALSASASVPDSQRTQFLYVPQVIHHAMLARVFWLEGNSTRAVELADESVSVAIASKHTLSICFATAMGACPVALWAGELAMASRNLVLLEEHSAALAVSFWHRFAEAYRRFLTTTFAALAMPISRRRCDDTQWGYRHFEEYSVLAEGFASPQLIERAWSTNPIWCSAEILRLEACKLLRERDTTAVSSVIEMLARSLAIARKQGALAWELRSATTLGGILRDQLRFDEARASLESVLERFPDKSATPDYQAALQLLDNCAP
nr:winged helix-turn-helix domain-containing protein [Caballeronia sp. dw_19]